MTSKASSEGNNVLDPVDAPDRHYVWNSEASYFSVQEWLLASVSDRERILARRTLSKGL